VQRGRVQNGGRLISEHPAQLAHKMTFSMQFSPALGLVIKDGERIEIYDTGNHPIFGVAQAQSVDQTLTFTSQDGLVRITDLRKV
jgi:hypothetical protein